MLRQYQALAVLLVLAACQTSGSEEPNILATSDLPAYEQSLDHAGIIENWSEEFYHRGLRVYRTACFSCHGTPDVPGTLPNSRQFWQEPFKYGEDPLSLYNTLTRGRGLMPPQVQLTPREKYAVIVFIREEFLREHNPEAFFEVTEAYLSGLPEGDSLGPPPTRKTPWKEMDYGPFLMRTYEIAHASEGPKGINRRGSPIPNEDFRDRNFAYKGIAIRLDPGEGGVAAGKAFALFDHDLMRLAAFWTGDGFIDWEDILLDDQHNIFPRIVGNLIVETPMTPGWVNPATDSTLDPRFRAVDGRQFGPLPRDWTHYKGLYVHNNRIIIHYTVGQARVLESYTLRDDTLLARTLNITGVTRPLTLRAAPDSVALTAIPSSAATLTQSNGMHRVTITADTNFELVYGSDEAAPGLPENLEPYTQGGPTQELPVLESPIVSGTQAGYAADVLTLPLNNPWKSRVRPTAIDFLAGGDQAVVTTIDGEVWHLSGITQEGGQPSNGGA